MLPLPASCGAAAFRRTLELLRRSPSRSPAAVVRSLRRNGYASVASIPRTRVTKLENGFTVATEAFPHMETCTAGVWINSGSRAETEENNGVAHFFEHMVFKGTPTRTQRYLEMEVEDMGSHLNAYTSREQTVYYARSFKHNVPRTLDILSDILQNSLVAEDAVERERDVILREQVEVAKNMEEVIFDHVHTIAFQGSSLGFTILGPAENIKSLTRNDLVGYVKKNYTADRMVLAAAGGVDHDQFVHYARQAFGNLGIAHGADRLNAYPAPTFTGSEMRISDEAAPQTHFALTVEGVGNNSSDYYPMLVMQTMIGSWDRTFGATEHEHDRLSNVAARRNVCNSYMAFNTAYSDTGLFGLYVITDNTNDMTEVVELSLKEWARLAAPGISEIEVQRAKQQLKASLLLGLDGTAAIAEDIGRQVVASGKYISPDQVAAMIDGVTAQDVQRAAKRYLRNRPISVVGIGRVDGLPSHKSISDLMYA